MTTKRCPAGSVSPWASGSIRRNSACTHRPHARKRSATAWSVMASYSAVKVPATSRKDLSKPQYKKTTRKSCSGVFTFLARTKALNSRAICAVSGGRSCKSPSKSVSGSVRGNCMGCFSCRREGQMFPPCSMPSFAMTYSLSWRICPFAPPLGKGRDRYSTPSDGHVRLRTAGRHINLKRIGVEGQQRIIPHQGGQLGHSPGAKLGESGLKRRWTRFVRLAQLLHVGDHDLLGGGQGRQRRVVPQGIHERIADALLTRSRSVRMPDVRTVHRPGGQAHDQFLDFLGQRRLVPQVVDQDIRPVTHLRTMDHHGTGAANDGAPAPSGLSIKASP